MRKRIESKAQTHYLFVHSAGMDPKQLLSRLMGDRGLHPTSLSRATRNATKQSQIHRFLSGDVKEPRRSTMQPVADVLGIPVEALLDEKAAAEAAQRLWPVEDSAEPVRIGLVQPATTTHDQSIADVIATLAIRLEALSDADRDAAADQLRTLAHAPDSAKAKAAIAKTLGGSTAGEAAPRKRHGT